MFRISVCVVIVLAITLFSTSLFAFDPVQTSLDMFKKYRHVIDSTNDGLVSDEPTAHTGDINSDGKIDVILQFGLYPKGANGIVMFQAAIYLNTGATMKVVGEFNPDYCGVIKKIENGFVYVNEYSACLTISGEQPIQKHKLKYRKGKLVEC